MKNRILTLIIVLVVGVGVFFIAKGYYYNNIYNYSKIIDESLEKYYVSEQLSDLEPLGRLKDLYENNEKMTVEVQDRIYGILKGWVDFLNEKYICDSSNVNSCRLYYNELDSMKLKIKSVNIYREQLINPVKFSTLFTELEMRSEEVKEIIDDPASVRPRNYEEIRLEKCNKTTECAECKTLLCECNYINSENKKEKVLCKVPLKEDK